MSGVFQGARTCLAAPAAIRRWALLGATVAAILGSTAAVASADAEVSIAFRAYQPATTTVNVGETVLWKNTTLMPHTVTAIGGEFDSGKMSGGTSFSYTFLKPGNFLYACTIHPSMKGNVIVRSAASAQAVVAKLSAHAAGGRRAVSVQAPRPGAAVLLELQRGGVWSPLSRAHLSAKGTATLSFKTSVRGALRVVVTGAAGESRLVSRTLHP